jgi:retron-type reverse transcriptase
MDNLSGATAACQWPSLSWHRLYSEAELYKSAIRLYTKPLFQWHKALSTSVDGRTLYDFARRGLQNLAGIHRRLANKEFSFRPGLALHRNFNGKRRTLYLYPWEERLVDLLLYRLLTRAVDPTFSSCSYAYRRTGFGVDRCQRHIQHVLRRLGDPIFVTKRDIADFFASIDQEILLRQLGGFIREDDYLFRLLRERVHFSCWDKGEIRRPPRGVPFGTAVGCFLANLFLSGLDRRLEAIPDLVYVRYADDILMLSRERTALELARRLFHDELTRLGLESKTSHAQDFVFTRFGSRDLLPAASRFRHLGLEYRVGGSVGLSRDKFRKICNLFRYAFRRKAGKFRRLRDPLGRARLAIDLASETIAAGIRNVAIIDYYLRHVNDECQIRQLDHWLAEEVLSLALGGGHKKGHFRSLSFRKLRAMGLPSLVHRRRLLRHRHIASSFFVWKNCQREKARRPYPRHEKKHLGPAARPVLDEMPAFSQDPEAAADSTL